MICACIRVGGRPRLGRPTRLCERPSTRRRCGRIRCRGRRWSWRGAWRRCHAAALTGRARRGGAWASRGLRAAVAHAVRDRRNDDDDRDDHRSDRAGTPVAAARITGPSGSRHPGISIWILISHVRAPRVPAGQGNARAQAPFLRVTRPIISFPGHRAGLPAPKRNRRPPALDLPGARPGTG
jgi:hypothetical protein